MPPIVNIHTVKPNEIVGYRIRPEHLNWTLVLVKRRGLASSRPGEEYDAATLGYFGRLDNVVTALIEHESRDQRLLGQRNAAEYEVTLRTIEAARQAALDAVAALARNWAENALTERDARKLMVAATRGHGTASVDEQSA